jgi:hypothetical protein
MDALLGFTTLNFLSVRRVRLPFIPTENTALGLRCAKFQFGPTPGSTGYFRSTSDRSDLAIGARDANLLGPSACLE